MSDLTRQTESDIPDWGTCPVCERKNVPIENGRFVPHRTDLQHDCPAGGKSVDEYELPKAKSGVRRQRYAVDWSDNAFPEIVPVEMHPYLGDDEGKTFADAKREIIEHFESLRLHAQEIIRKTRALRVADVAGGAS